MILDNNEKEGVFYSDKWEWAINRVPSIDHFYKILVKERRLFNFCFLHHRKLNKFFLINFF